MSKSIFRALTVVAVLAAPTFSFGAQLCPGAPAPDPIWKTPTGKVSPGAPAPDPIWKTPTGKLCPGAPAPDPIWKTPTGK